MKKYLFVLVAVLLFFSECNGGNDNSGQGPVSHKVLMFNSASNAASLFLNIRPKISDHRGGQLFSIAKDNFLKEWLPYADTYLPVNPGWLNNQSVSGWVFKDSRGIELLVINQNNWDNIPLEIQDHAIFSHYLRLYAYTTYVVESYTWNSANDQDSGSKNSWLDFWIHQTSELVNANCFATALYASGIDVKFPSEVSAEVFTKHLQTDFIQVSQPLTGDLAVLKIDSKYIIHAATFFGVSKSNSKQKIFLSKNGKGIGKIQFLDEWTLRNKNYPESNELSFWRRKRGLDEKQ